MNALENAYLAGFFDGEGCVIIQKAMKNVGSVSPVWQMSVRLAQVDRRPLDILKERFGGGVYDAHYGRLALSPAFQWSICSKEAAGFLKTIRPYCIVKAEEIDVALAFQEQVSIKRYHRRLTKKDIAFRERHRLKLQALKRRFRTRHKSLREPYHSTRRGPVPRA